MLVGVSEPWTGLGLQTTRWLAETDTPGSLPQVQAAQPSGTRSWGIRNVWGQEAAPHPCQITLPLCLCRERERPQVLERPSSADPEIRPQTSEAQHQRG